MSHATDSARLALAFAGFALLLLAPGAGGAEALDVTRFGAVPADGADDTAAIQAAIDAALRAGRGVVTLPPGGYRISAPLRVAIRGDRDVRLTIAGEGWRDTAIHQVDPGRDVFEFTSTGQNLRGVVRRDLCLSGGATALKLVRCSYLQFRNVTFFSCARAPGSYAVTLDQGSGSNRFDSCTWVHTVGDAMWVRSGSALLSDPILGEDCGGLVVSTGGSVLSVRGGRLNRGTFDRSEPAGHSGLGRAVFTARGGTLILDGLTGYAEGNLVNLVGVERLVISACAIEIGKVHRRPEHSYPGCLIAARAAFGHASVVVTGNAFDFAHPEAALVRCRGGPPGGWVIANNAFATPHAGASLAFPAAMEDPALGNVLAPNVIRRGAE